MASFSDMAHFYGFRRLTKAEDWRALARAEDRAANHASYELARAWQGAGGIPAGIVAALDAAGMPELGGLELDVGVVEKPVLVDTTMTPSVTDLTGYARNSRDDVVILAVEGKAHEPAGISVRAWLRGDAREPHPGAMPRRSRERRFEFLCERLGLALDLECGLQYQLLHRTVSAVVEAELHGAVAAVLLIHAFGAMSPGHWSDYELFLKELGLDGAVPARVSGPASLGTRRSMPTYFLWWQDPTRSETA
ncbi:MAG TPA: hypothetical protein VLE53_06525 [Gemmatimonadaceae bacterium]|nr:hypothetical protein [Gemmatimonadaceae bacterium]